MSKKDELSLVSAESSKISGLFEGLHHGINFAGNQDTVYESISIIEDNLVGLWEAGVADQDIFNSIAQRDLAKCYIAIEKGLSVNVRHDDFGISPEDARKLKYLLSQLAFPSYSRYLRDQEATQLAREAKAEEREESRKFGMKIAEAERLEALRPKHPFVTKENLKAIFGVCANSIDYDEKAISFQIRFGNYFTEITTNSRMLSNILNHEKIKYLMLDKEEKILIQDQAALIFIDLIESQLPLIFEQKERDSLNHPLFNKKNFKNILGIESIESIESIKCRPGDQWLGIKELLAIDFVTSRSGKMDLQKFVVFLRSKHIDCQIYDYTSVEISNKNIALFAKILGGTHDQLEREFGRYFGSLPEDHQSIFAKHNIEEKIDLPRDSILTVKYRTNPWLNRVELAFASIHWKEANKLLFFLKKSEIKYETQYNEDFSLNISILTEKMPEFINILMKKPMEIALPGLAVLSEKTINMTKKNISFVLGEEIAKFIEKIDLSEYSIENSIYLHFNNSLQGKMSDILKKMRSIGFKPILCATKNPCILLHHENDFQLWERKLMEYTLENKSAEPAPRQSENSQGFLVAPKPVWGIKKLREELTLLFPEYKGQVKAFKNVARIVFSDKPQRDKALSEINEILKTVQPKSDIVIKKLRSKNGKLMLKLINLTQVEIQKLKDLKLSNLSQAAQMGGINSN